MSETTRKVVAATAIKDGRQIVAICDDGAVFVTAGGSWREWPSVPGTPREEYNEARPPEQPKRGRRVLHRGLDDPRGFGKGEG